ncbi:DUF2946 family protein [uncultured Roseovarius sp.]|uniref:DUF2946 family protein n=1 Tax=uncultured Roseovarius sp. TaxID=293344 RepID=UPI0026065DA1|nr:DUF2946 family protein [uncultured Roseovarius sp.]
MAAQTNFRRYLLTALLLLPVLTMSIFPQGTMAARGAQGMEVVLCTGNGPMTVIVDENGTPIEGEHTSTDCGWWLLGQGLCLTGAQETPALFAVALGTLSPVTGRFAEISHDTSHYPARAPPVV